MGSLTGYVNPIVNDTGRDPSTAWKTPAGMSNAAATPCPIHLFVGKRLVGLI